MEKLFEIYNELSQQGVKMYDCRIDGSCAAVIEMHGKYALFLDTEQVNPHAKERCAAAHEAGHIMPGATHHVCSPLQLIQQHENRADRWAIQKLIPPEELQTALDSGLTDMWELAERFDVTEDFMRKTCELYIDRLGIIKNRPQCCNTKGG